MPEIQKNLLTMIGVILFAYVLIFILAPRDIADFTVVDTEYWRESQNRLLVKTAYEYNNKADIERFPVVLGEWRGYNYSYPKSVYESLNADILLARGYQNGKGLIWMDIINSKVGESFHRQNICVEGAGWKVINESIAEFTIAESQSNIPFTRLYANKLDLRKGNSSQVMVYWFMFKKFNPDQSVTMIRLSAPVIGNETQTYLQIRKFIEEQLFQEMYKRSSRGTGTLGEIIIEKYGIGGYLILASFLLIPGFLVFWNRLMKLFKI